MKTVNVADIQKDPESIKTLVDVLNEDGVICFPAESNYRLGASALSPAAVSSLMAAKRRSAHAPALVFVADEAMLAQIAGPLPDLALKLAREFWPGPLTLLVEPGEVFPSKVRKALTRATGRIGVRVPGHEVARAIVRAFGGPLLVSSANLSKKKGAASPAQVRKNFGREVEAMVECGDLPTAAEPSTLVAVDGDGFTITRPGAITAEAIERVVAS